MGTLVYEGSCHCAAVRFQVEANEELELLDCNCSLCQMQGYQHLIVPKSAFRLLHGDDALSCYRFHTGVAQHLFCKHCGVKSFYIPRSNPDGVSVNARCIDTSAAHSVTLVPFDGQDWEANGPGLRHLSVESE